MVGFACGFRSLACGFRSRVRTNLFARVLKLPAEQNLVDDDEDLVEVVHEVDLPDVVEEVIQDLHEQMDRLQTRQLVIADVHAKNEVKPRVFAVDQLVLPELREWNAKMVSETDERTKLQTRDIDLRRADKPQSTPEEWLRGGVTDLPGSRPIGPEPSRLVG